MTSTGFFKAALAILRKDLRAEIRSFELVSAMLLFTLLSVLVFSFALELDANARSSTVSGVLWVTLVFAAILGLNRSMASEREQGNLDAMMLAPIPRSAIYLGKMLANFLFTFAVGAVLISITAILYNLPLLKPAMLSTLALGILGLTSIGTLLAAMTAQTRSRETLLPIILLPTALPVLLAVVRATSGILNDAPTELWIGWLGMLQLIDLVYVVMCFALFTFVIED